MYYQVIEWHLKIEELRLQELKLNRELAKQKAEIKYLNNIISEYERTINNLEEEIVQQNKVYKNIVHCSIELNKNILQI